MPTIQNHRITIQMIHDECHSAIQCAVHVSTTTTTRLTHSFQGNEIEKFDKQNNFYFIFELFDVQSFSVSARRGEFRCQ